MNNQIISIRNILHPTPLMTTKHIYIGESNKHWTYGETYTVISSGHNWYKGWSYGTWVTCDEYPDTTDEGYGVFVDPNEFYRLFINH